MWIAPTAVHTVFMKRALVVGINEYRVAPLKGCVKDAQNVHARLSQHGDGDPNYDTYLLTSERQEVTRLVLLDKLKALLMEPAESAVFYFSGHGSRNLLGGYLVTQEASRADQGLAFHDLQTLVLRSPIPEITLILDCCYSGGMGNEDGENPIVELRQGVTILAASQPEQLARETIEGGIFTNLLLNALDGEAADLLGNITLAGLYANIAGLLTAWDQRPIFKQHVFGFHPIRQVKPEFNYGELRQLNRMFPTLEHELQLDKRYEPTEEPKDPQKEADFALLQRMRLAGLVIPMAPHIHLYYAAMHGGKMVLTHKGRFYWTMCKRKG